MDEEQIAAMRMFCKYAQDVNENNNSAIKKDDNLTKIVTERYISLQQQQLNLTKNIFPVQIIAVILKYVFAVVYDYLHCVDSQIDKIMNKKDRYIVPYILNDSTHNSIDKPNTFCYESHSYIASYKGFFLHNDNNDWECYYCGESSKFDQHYCVNCTGPHPSLYFPKYQWKLYIHELALFGKVVLCFYAENQFQPLWSHTIYSYGIEIHDTKIHIFKYLLDTTDGVDDSKPEYEFKQTESNLTDGDTVLMAVKYNKCFITIRDSNSCSKETVQWCIPTLKYQLCIKICPISYANTRIELVNFCQQE